MKKFEKVEKTGFFKAKFLLHCTLSFILGTQYKNISVDLLVLARIKDHISVSSLPKDAKKLEKMPKSSQEGKKKPPKIPDTYLIDNCG